jgi:hypothetical protein
MGTRLSARAPSKEEDGMTDNATLDAAVLRINARQGEEMARRVHDFLGRFVAFPTKEAHVAVSLWVIHAHLMDRWESTPRLAFLSAEPASGKTRALEILELLVPNPVIAINVSPAYLFRKVGGDEPVTLLYDEIDTVFGPKARENEEIRGLLNAGHRTGAVAGRCVVRGKNIETEDIPAYAAVALAGLGWLPDTILSRSVVIRMRRRHAGEHVEAYRRRENAPEGARIRKQIELWVRSQPAEITNWPKMPAEIQDRDADVWEALLAVADAIGGSRPDRARVAAMALVAASREAEPSLNIRLLSDIQLTFEGDVMASKAILARLLELEEAPWKDLKGRPLNERGLAHRLRQFGIKSRTIRIGDTTPKGYLRTDFHDAWSRYLLSPDKSETSATSATNTQIQPVRSIDDVANVADAVEFVRPEKLNGHNVVADVADSPRDASAPLVCPVQRR